MRRRWKIGTNFEKFARVVVVASAKCRHRAGSSAQHADPAELPRHHRRGLLGWS